MKLNGFITIMTISAWLLLLAQGISMAQSEEQAASESATLPEKRKGQGVSA